MSSTELYEGGSYPMTTEQKLWKEIDRLKKALKVAQNMNAGLEADKDSAWMLLQLVLSRLPNRRATIPLYEVMEYKPERWQVDQVTSERFGVLRLELLEK